MADFICLAMASQYTENSPAALESPQPSNNTTSSFRRSLGATTIFGGRRSSRSAATTARPDSSSSLLAVEEAKAAEKVHIRIVPSIENPSRSLIFQIIERDLEIGRVIKIGRFTDRSSVQNHISFKSKVVSRSHCEIWLNNEGKIQLKDTRSSSGTFVNHVRLSPANTESRAFEIRDGDLVQLGVDYQGGYEEIYRSVRMRFEVNRSSCPLSYSMSVFNNLHHLTHVSSAEIEVEECCICLYALAPFQALFVAPCSHSFHFKCIRPLFDSYPGFQCPICRTYSDLDATVAIEAEEVIEKFGFQQRQKSSVSDESSPRQQSSSCSLEPPLSTTLVACSTTLTGLPTVEEQVSQGTRDHRATIILEDNIMCDEHHEPTGRNGCSTSRPSSMSHSNFVEKIKTVFSNSSHGEKQRANQAKSSNRKSSEENDERSVLLDTMASSSSRAGTALQPILSRQSTYYNSLNGILEESVVSTRTATITLSEQGSN
ncbi:MAG: hypothetical protein EXX96DRAFT_232402 [Benjaminiella poitrasii]|nr:MAG: hypothetical protein EXX96DRAFT_232402 [Benjaminiella poitrasii]